MYVQAHIDMGLLKGGLGGGSNIGQIFGWSRACVMSSRWTPSTGSWACTREETWLVPKNLGARLVAYAMGTKYPERGVFESSGAGAMGTLLGTPWRNLGVICYIFDSYQRRHHKG